MQIELYDENSREYIEDAIENVQMMILRLLPYSDDPELKNDLKEYENINRQLIRQLVALSG